MGYRIMDIQSRPEELVKIEYDEIVHYTDLAYLLLICEEEYWIPFSIIKEHDIKRKIFTIPYYFAHKEGLI